jgi:purine nucleoside permease
VVTALVFSRPFDLSLTYFIRPASRNDPAQGTLPAAGATWWSSAFNGRSTRETRPTGRPGIPGSTPRSDPKPPLEYGTEVFQLEGPAARAYAEPRRPLADNAGAAISQNQPCAGEPPSSVLW